MRTETVVQSLLAAATSAPSSHNTQPWRWQAAGGVLDLYADRSRALPVNDPEGRELVISCGAALMALRVAAADEGLPAVVTVLPEGAGSDHLARIVLGTGPADPAAADLGVLRAALGRRRTARGRLSVEPVDPAVLERVAAAVATEGARLVPVPAAARPGVAGLVAAGDHAQFASRAWRRELAAWLHPVGAADGLTVPAWALPVARLVVGGLARPLRPSRPPGGSGAPDRRPGPVATLVAARDARLATRAPALVVLATAADDPPAWLQAGQALMRGLLVAASEGVAAGHLNQPCQVGGGLRRGLAEVAGVPGTPQLLLRLGCPPGRPRNGSTGRRPVSAVLSEGAEQEVRPE